MTDSLIFDAAWIAYGGTDVRAGYVPTLIYAGWFHNKISALGFESGASAVPVDDGEQTTLLTHVDGASLAQGRECRRA